MLFRDVYTFPNNNYTFGIINKHNHRNIADDTETNNINVREFQRSNVGV